MSPGKEHYPDRPQAQCLTWNLAVCRGGDRRGMSHCSKVFAFLSRSPGEMPAGELSLISANFVPSTQHPAFYLPDPGGCLRNVSQEIFEEATVLELDLAQTTESEALIPLVKSVLLPLAFPKQNAPVGERAASLASPVGRSPHVVHQLCLFSRLLYSEFID